MAEVTFRIPSKVVQYGYIEFPFKVPDDASPETLATVYVNYVYAFQKEEQEALQRLADGVREASTPKAPRPYDEDVQEAVRALDEGLGGVTEVAGDESTVAPWDQPAAAAAPKPWEQESKPVADLGEGW